MVFMTPGPLLAEVLAEAAKCKPEQIVTIERETTSHWGSFYVQQEQDSVRYLYAESTTEAGKITFLQKW